MKIRNLLMITLLSVGLSGCADDDVGGNTTPVTYEAYSTSGFGGIAYNTLGNIEITQSEPRTDTSYTRSTTLNRGDVARIWAKPTRAEGTMRLVIISGGQVKAERIMTAGTDLDVTGGSVTWVVQ